MAFAASTVRTRHIAAGNIPILKNDFVNLANDLIAIETLMATASDQVGKFKSIFLAGLSSGASSLLNGGAVSELTATPATNIPLHHLDVGSLAATATTNRGKWKQLLLAEQTVTPGTNITIRDLSSTNLETVATISGDWRSIILGANRVGVTTATGLPNTNIGLCNLKGATITSIANAQFGVAGVTAISFVGLGNISGGNVNAGTFRYFIPSIAWISSVGTTTFTFSYMGGLGCVNQPASGGSQGAYAAVILCQSTAAPTIDGTSSVVIQSRVIEISEV